MNVLQIPLATYTADFLVFSSQFIDYTSTTSISHSNISTMYSTTTTQCNYTFLMHTSNLREMDPPYLSASKDDINTSLLSQVPQSTQNTSLEVHSNPNTQSEKKTLLLESYRALSELEIYDTSAILHHARLLDIKDKEIEALYITTTTWITKLNEINLIKNFVEKGDSLIQSWKEFAVNQQKFAKLVSSDSDEYVLTSQQIDRFKHVIITLSYLCYMNAMKQQPILKNELEFKLKIYKCHKMLGDYQEALYMMQGICSNYSSAMLYSELADCYYLTKNINNAKSVFREVFFINPSDVQLENIESPMIHNILTLIRDEQRYSEFCIKDWIPVYGYINNTFTIVRELKPIELNNINNDIMNMEAKLDDHRALGRDDPSKIIPALLNRYFWMIEHYKKTDLDTHKTKIQVLMNNIQKHDEHIYKKLKER